MKLSETLRAAADLFRQSGNAWVEDRASRLGAAMSYYTVFSLAPLLVISIAVAGFVVGGDSARDAIIESMGGLIGQDGGKAIEAMIDNAAKHEGRGVVATTLGILMLLVGASGFFIELQDALNTVWGVETKTSSGIRGFLRHRLFSFAIVIGVGFLLLVSMVLTAALTVMGEWMSGALPGGAGLWQVINFLISLAVTAGLFAMIFKIVPDLKLAWRDVAVGSAVTAVLFTAGKFAIGFYLGKSATASVFGAAGSLAVLFIWIYYSAQIVLFGAEFTQVWACAYGSKRDEGWNAKLENERARLQSGSREPARRDGRVAATDMSRIPGTSTGRS